MDAPRRTSSDELDAMWRHQLVFWHLLFAALLAIVVGLIVVARGPWLWWQLACLGGIVGAYAVWGRRGLVQQEGRAAVLYVGLAWVLFLVLVALDVEAQPWLLTFALFPQTWAMLARRRAIAVVCVASVGFGAVLFWQTDRTGSDAAGIALTTGIMLSLSLVLGLFIDRMVREADARARVIDELHRAQDELAAAERAQGVFEERERLSREIHDTLAQGFTSVVTLARATESALERGDLDTVRDRLALIEDTAAANLSEARLIVAELTPGHLQSRTLSEALQRLVDAVASESGMTGRLRVDGEPVVLPANSEVVLLRTAQEALSNVRRHSGAASFEVALSYAVPGTVALDVTDDGQGFEPGTARRGFGLDGAIARAAEVTGSFVVDSRPGAGTTVRVEVPR
jgi:signal transduction histidine kinase